MTNQPHTAVDPQLIDVVDTSAHSILILDGHNRVMHANPTFLHQTSRSGASVDGSYINLLSPISNGLDVDPLTGLSTRASLSAAVQSELDVLADRVATGVSQPGLLAVMMVEIGGLKRVNDGLGRALGDVLIRAAGQRLLRMVPIPGIVSRVGGAEFGLVFAGVNSAAEAALLAEKICAQMADPFEVVIDNANAATPIHVHTVVGIAVASNADMSADQLIGDADAALAHVKTHEVRNWELFAPHMRVNSQSMFASERALRQAIDQGELCVHFQPEVSFGDGASLGAEALVRWQHPEKGLVTAGAFVGLAEETGLVVPIGWWVLGEACRQAAAWHAAGFPLTIRINLSGKQVAHPDLMFEVARALEESGVDPSKVCLEITETVLMSDAQLALERLQQLKEFGLHLAIDDFGTGYSSLSYLKRFPVDVLKIDKSFVDGLANSALDRSIVSAIIELAHAMDLEVTAEGIEHLDQVAVLQSLGCERGQGFYFAKPMPAADFPLSVA
jgi:diguanylate cyclase (GGDEF)-like protein